MPAQASAPSAQGKEPGATHDDTDQRNAKIEAALALIEAGDSERGACRSVGISRSTFRVSVIKVAAGAQYARACEGLARDQVEKIEEVLDKLEAGEITPDVARVLIDPRKWIASKLFPKQWGDRTVLAGDKDAPLVVESATDLERAKALAALVEAVKSRKD